MAVAVHSPSIHGPWVFAGTTDDGEKIYRGSDDVSCVLDHLDHLVYSGEAYEKNLRVFSMFREAVDMVHDPSALSQEKMFTRFVKWMGVYKKYVDTVPRFNTPFLNDLVFSIEFMLDNFVEPPENDHLQLKVYNKVKAAHYQAFEDMVDDAEDIEDHHCTYHPRVEEEEEEVDEEEKVDVKPVLRRSKRLKM